ncbi:coenzyme F390 synthetase-like protein [Paenibacillus algicola]|uniref:Coenzyme F390 synthetase-like protein n=1 Tax=Paenibacillus algicola TaxID=2565926 RepID=A0A4P8XNP7_9BACL|nr:CoF synthetase [Paenibacillus algicola]QCT03905.1 coenzyme F390 synthetase-like protein [Paenibacillus algicola]
MISSEQCHEMIARVSGCCPWYVTWAGLDFKNRNLRLSSLPLMTSSVLEQYYYTPDSGLSAQSGMLEYRTSGTSSGRRKSIFYTPSDEHHYVNIKLDVYRTILGADSYRSALADMGTGHAEATAVEVFQRLGMTAESISFRLPIEQHLEKLLQFQPEVLYTMPSILERILLTSPDPAAYGIRKVVLVGEIAPKGWMARAAEQLNLTLADMTDTYGSIEIGTMAYYSHEHGRYVLTDGLTAEGVGAEELGEGLEPLPPGEQILVLTSSVREAFPAIRYVTYDVVRDLRPIEVNGVQRMSFDSIVKRVGPDLKHGEKISIYDIEDVLYRRLGTGSVRVHMDLHGLQVKVYSPAHPTSGEPAFTSAELEAAGRELEQRIPEIAAMVQAGIIGRITVTEQRFQDEDHRSAVKQKKIHYNHREGSA